MTSDFVISDIPTGKLNAMVKKIMAQAGVDDPEEAVSLMNSDELWVYNKNPKWTEKKRDTRFFLTSDGTSGKRWVSCLKNKNCRFGDFAESVLRSKSFKPTNGITYEIAVIGANLFGNINLSDQIINDEAKNRGYMVPNPEISCLIREKLSDDKIKEMGFERIVIMHEPIMDCSGTLAHLGTFNYDNGPWLIVNHNFHHFHFQANKSIGFAYVVSQTT